jgi:hypothetical protein
MRSSCKEAGEREKETTYDRFNPLELLNFEKYEQY